MTRRTTTPSRLLPPMLAAALAGCASGGAQINASTTQPSLEPAKKVLLYFNARSPHFTGALYSTFVDATRRRIESCGVEVTVLEFDPLEIDMRGKFAKTLQQASPNVILSVVRNGGNLVSGSGGVSGSLYFDAEARDTRQSKSVWKARIDYRTLTQNLFVDDKQSGERFAAQFAARVANDGLVTGCPQDVLAPKP